MYETDSIETYTIRFHDIYT